jgi:hypothetical protein
MAGVLHVGGVDEAGAGGGDLLGEERDKAVDRGPVAFTGGILEKAELLGEVALASEQEQGAEGMGCAAGAGIAQAGLCLGLSPAGVEIGGELGEGGREVAEDGERGRHGGRACDLEGEPGTGI